MFQPKCPLRYNISDWHQLTHCRSNNSKKLCIEVTDFINQDELNGTRIQVLHTMYGPLFTYIVDCKGSIVSYDSDIPVLSTVQVLEILESFGFLVTYQPNKSIPGDQLQYLMTLSNLHYDKIRILNVWKIVDNVKQFKSIVVAFQIKYLSDWLNSGYSPNVEEYNNALNNGWAINVSSISDAESYSWDWLYGWVANISDIIADNA